MTTHDTTNGAAIGEVSRLQQRITDLERQIAAQAASNARLSCVEAQLGIFQALIESAIDGISFATPDQGGDNAS